jgi:hypothetical protein
MKRRSIIGAIFILLPVVSTVFYSCYYDYGLDTTNLDVVSTFYDNGYSFSNVNSYFLADSVVHDSQISNNYDDQILTKVESELNALGWTRLYPGGNDTADVTVLISALSTTTTVAYYNDWYSYWGWYGGWGYYPSYGYGAGWSWYYPYYPTYSYYSYTTGTIIITLTDPRTGNTAEQKLPVQWLCVINGLLDGVNVSSRINTTIDQAFTQSPYLR